MRHSRTPREAQAENVSVILQEHITPGMIQASGWWHGFPFIVKKIMQVFPPPSTPIDMTALPSALNDADDALFAALEASIPSQSTRALRRLHSALTNYALQAAKAMVKNADMLAPIPGTASPPAPDSADKAATPPRLPGVSWTTRQPHQAFWARFVDGAYEVYDNNTNQRIGRGTISETLAYERAPFSPTRGLLEYEEEIIRALFALRAHEAQHETLAKAFPYGRCPICGDAGITRERRPNGDDRCVNAHVYPSRDAVPFSAELQKREPPAF